MAEMVNISAETDRRIIHIRPAVMGRFFLPFVGTIETRSKGVKYGSGSLDLIAAPRCCHHVWTVGRVFWWEVSYVRPLILLKLLRRAQTAHDPELLLYARRSLGNTSHGIGEFSPARGHFERRIALYLHARRLRQSFSAVERSGRLRASRTE